MASPINFPLLKPLTDAQFHLAAIEPYTECSFSDNILRKNEKGLGYIIAAIIRTSMPVIRDGAITRKWLADVPAQFIKEGFISDIFWYVLYGPDAAQILLIGNESNTVGFTNPEFRNLFFEADQGNIEAQFQIGSAYLHAPPTPFNLQLAKRYLSLAAMQKHSEALYIVGRHALKDSLFTFTPEQALNLIIEADKLGNPNASYRLGRFYATGLFLSQDHDAAFKYYAKAAAMNHPQANALLGDCFAKGIGTSVDWFQACFAYKQSLESGCLDARYSYAMAFLGKDLRLPFCFDLTIKHLFIGQGLGHQASRETFLLYFPDESSSSDSSMDDMKFEPFNAGLTIEPPKFSPDTTRPCTPLKSPEELFQQRQALPSPSKRNTVFPVTQLVNMADEQILIGTALHIWNQEGYFFDGTWSSEQDFSAKAQLKYVPSNCLFSTQKVWDLPQNQQIPLSINLLYFAARLNNRYAKDLLNIAVRSQFFDCLKGTDFSFFMQDSKNFS